MSVFGNYGFTYTPPGGGGGAGNVIAVSDEGIVITAAATFLNFVGAGVTATVNGSGVDITIPGGGGGSNPWIKTPVANPTFNPSSGNTGAIAIGSAAAASGFYALAFGSFNTASGTFSTALGYANTASGQNSLALGVASVANSTGAIAIGNTATAAASPYGYTQSIAIGDHANSKGIAIGLYANSQEQNSIAIGPYAKTGTGAAERDVMVFGYNARNFSYDNAIVMGSNAYTFATDAIAIGVNAGVSGALGVAIGVGASASSRFGVSIGWGASVLGDYSQAIGVTAQAINPDETAFVRKHVITGQTSRNTLQGSLITTTDNTPTTLYPTVILPTNTAGSFIGTVVAFEAATGDTASWRIAGAWKNIAGVYTIVGAPEVHDTGKDAGAAALSLSVTAGASGLQINVTGDIGRSFAWSANISTAQST